MRRCLVIFMLFLLPIRGLVGDAMAYSMLPAGLAPAQTVTQVAMDTGAVYANSMGFSSTFDAQNAAPAGANPPCHMDMGMGMATAGDADTTASQCTTCLVCHLSASIPMQLHNGMLHTSKAVPAQQAAHWISADPRLLAKTPVL